MEAGAQVTTASPPGMPPGAGHNVFYARAFHFEDNKVVTSAPYSAQATTETVQVLSDGNRIVRKETAQVYRDSKGRTRRDLSLGAIGPWSSAAGPVEVVNIFDPVANAHYMLNVQEKKAYKMPPHKGGMPEPPPPPPGPGVAFIMKGEEIGSRKEESLGTQMMEGLQVQGMRTTETIPAGQIGNEKPIVITTEHWYSPELQTDVLEKRSDPRMGDVVHQLTNINRNEPEASLFQVPADYTVVNGPMIVRKHMQ
jgi:hypothetical protein